MKRFVMLVAVLIASFVAWPAGQVMGQAPQPGTPVQPAVTGTAFLAGQVVDVATGRPISEVQVQVSGRSGGSGRGFANLSVATDAQGRFFFRNLAAAVYTIRVQRSGYTPVRNAMIELGDNERIINAH